MEAFCSICNTKKIKTHRRDGTGLKENGPDLGFLGFFPSIELLASEMQL